MALVAATPNGIAVVDRSVVTDAVTGADVRSLVAGPAGSGRLFAGTQGEGVLRSDDDGVTWSPAGLRGHIVKALATSGPGTVWAATKPPRLFRSHDAGVSWDELRAFGRMRRSWWFQPAERPFTSYVSTLAVAPASPDVVVAGIEAFKLLRSADGGASWKRLRRGLPFDAHQLVVDARGRLLLASGGGAAFSADDGATWSKLMEGLDRHYGFCIAADFAEAGSAFLAAAPVRSAHTANARACVFRLDGQRWRKLSGGLPPELEQLPYALATSPAHPGTVYAGLGDGTLWRSTDRGESWRIDAVRLPGIRRLVLTA